MRGVDPLSRLQQAEVDRLLVQLKEPDTPDGRRWPAALAALRLLLEGAFVALDRALADRT